MQIDAHKKIIYIYIYIYCYAIICSAGLQGVVPAKSTN